MRPTYQAITLNNSKHTVPQPAALSFKLFTSWPPIDCIQGSASSCPSVSLVVHNCMPLLQCQLISQVAGLFGFISGTKLENSLPVQYQKPLFSTSAEVTAQNTPPVDNKNNRNSQLNIHWLTWANIRSR
ncbi:hypothetical protein SRABI106_01017 [Rahnella aquatilis]|nr:hypothetical protein SRABI106_01017 [Rahnella aquatilis]